MNEKPLSKEFVQAVWNEMLGTQMLDGVATGKANMGPAYRVGEDSSSEVLFESAFVERVTNNCVKVFTNASIPNELKTGVLRASLVAAIKFGMYLQRRTNERGGMIL